MKLSTVVYQFFSTYLPHIKGVSNATIKTYRDAFTLFLPFAANYYSIKINALSLDHLSAELILAFLQDLEQHRKNSAKTRNHRLAVIKSLAKMIRFMHPDKKQLADNILSIPQKRMQKKLIGFLYPDEIDKVLNAVDLKKSQGLRDYCILQLLYDSGVRASELATLNLDYFDPQRKVLAILGKGNRYRQIELAPKTCQLLKLYMTQYRIHPKPLYQQRLFINQRNEDLPAMVFIASVENISQWPCRPNVSNSSMPSTVFVTAAPLECLPAATPSLKSKIIWATIKLNPPWCISNWIWQEKNTSSSNLSNTPNRFYPMIQISINSSIGKTKKILSTGSTASKPHGPRFVAEISY